MVRSRKIFKFFIIMMVMLTCFIGIYLFNQKKRDLVNDYYYKISVEYLNYLNLSEEEKEKVNIIPNKYVYTVNNSVQNVGILNLPKEYDLRNVNGENFITPNKNQGLRGICWAFSAVSVMETSVIKKGYSSIDNPQIFSEYQLDFALSDDGIKNYSGGNRQLTTGNSTKSTLNFINKGYSPVFLQNFSENYYSSYPIDYADVYETQNAEYFFADSSNIIATSSASKIDKIKKYIMDYGSIIVDTQSPIGACAHEDPNNNIYIDVNSSCYEIGGHSMSVIGWDDYYTQTYSVNGENHKITGAFILKNSWGENYPFVYLSYDSINTSYYGLGAREIINFDN